MATAIAVKSDTVRVEVDMAGCPGSWAVTAGAQETGHGSMAGAQWEGKAWHVQAQGPLDDRAGGG